MPDKSKTLSRFTSGIDRRQPEDVSSNKSAPQFWDLLNCHVNSQMQIEKRGGVEDRGLMQGDVVGLFAFNEKLWTFEKRGRRASTHPDVWTIGKLDFPSNVDKIVALHYAGVFLGGVYVALEFDTGKIRHYYLNPGLRTWDELARDKEALKADPEGLQILPTAAVDPTTRTADLGVFYEAVALGDATTGAEEPEWPRSVVKSQWRDKPGGGRVRVRFGRIWDNEILWKAYKIRPWTAKTAISYRDEGRYYIHPADNGFIYRAINLIQGDPGKETGDAPVWPVIDGDTVVDGAVVWQAIAAPKWTKNTKFDIDYPIVDVGVDEDEYDHEALRAFAFPSDAYTTEEKKDDPKFDQFRFIYIGTWGQVHVGDTEPKWPRKPGKKVTDGAITWECVSTRVTDRDCPHTAQVLAHQSKIYAIGSSIGRRTEDDIVRFSATGDPFDWSTDDDAGFLPTGMQAAGSEIARALGKLNDTLVVFMTDSIEIWAVTPDPATAALIQVIGNIGTEYGRTVTPFSTDLLFLSPLGVRSVQQQSYTANLEDSDVGAPLDDLLAEAIKSIDPNFPPLATYYTGKGQYWLALGKTVFVYSWGQLYDVAAWSRYELDSVPRYFAETANGDLYWMDDGRHLNFFNLARHKDALDFEVLVRGAYTPLGRPGMLKQVTHTDVVLVGTGALSHAYDARDLNKETAPIVVDGNTRPGESIPVECCATEIAPVIRYTGNGPFRCDAISYYYNEMDVI